MRRLEKLQRVTEAGGMRTAKRRLYTLEDGLIPIVPIL